MITAEEGLKIRSIKLRVAAKQHVSADEKQWVLDLLAREQEPVLAEVVRRAANSGFNVNGIVTL